MKFLYEYRTSDNVHHDGTINAPDREAAYAALKAQGIRPRCVAVAARDSDQHLQRGGYDIPRNAGERNEGARFVPNLARTVTRRGRYCLPLTLWKPG